MDQGKHGLSKEEKLRQTEAEVRTAGLAGPHGKCRELGFSTIQRLEALHCRKCDILPNSL